MAEANATGVYYDRSGGGLTLTGANRSHSPNSLRRSFARRGKRITRDGVDGICRRSVIENFFYLDTYLMDIKTKAAKNTNSSRHSRTKKYSKTQKDCAEREKTYYKNPVIPTFNATPDEIRRSRALRTLGTVSEMHILPYHRIGSTNTRGSGASTIERHRAAVKGTDERMLEVVKSKDLKGR
jgi:pyruvate-formate lyase-activating enzyme